MRYGIICSSVRPDPAQRAGEAAELRRRHLEWLLDYARQADLEGPDQGAWLDLLETDLENFRIGLEDASAAEPRLELAGMLAPFWMVRGHTGLGRRWPEGALAAAGPAASPRLRAAALDGLGQLAAVQADYQAQRSCQQESLTIWRALGDDARVASCLGDLGSAAHIRGEYGQARAMYAEALEVANGANDSRLMARCLSGLGRLALHQGDLAKATDYYTDSMACFSRIGDLRRATLILGNLGVVALNRGEFDLARARFEEHLGNARKIGDRKLIGGALTNLGSVVYNCGDLDTAADLHAEALALAEQVGDRRLASVALTNLGLVMLARKDYPAARGQPQAEPGAGRGGGRAPRRRRVPGGTGRGGRRRGRDGPGRGPVRRVAGAARGHRRAGPGTGPGQDQRGPGRGPAGAGRPAVRGGPGPRPGPVGDRRDRAGEGVRSGRRLSWAGTREGGIMAAVDEQARGASPVDFGAFGDYGDFRPKRQRNGDQSAGEFVRAAYPFQGRISADGSTGYPAEPGRYHLYISWACPWAQRTAIVRKLMGLDEVISLSAVDPVRDGRGWAFREGRGHGLDPVNSFALLREAYEATEPGYDGHISVPVLWDRASKRIVSNNFPDITIDLETQFGDLGPPAGRPLPRSAPPGHRQH